MTYHDHANSDYFLNTSSHMLKKEYTFAMAVGLIILSFVGVGTVHAVKIAAKGEQIQVKQDTSLKNRKEVSDIIGIYSPGFEQEALAAQEEYMSKYGVEAVQVINYRDFVLIVPPAGNESIDQAKAEVDLQIASLNEKAPTLDQVTREKTIIRETFSVAGEIVYDDILGAYTDEQGFQYNFSQGELVNKQVGATGQLAAMFDAAYPHFQPDVVRTSSFTNEQLRESADEVIDILFASDVADALKRKVTYLDFGDARVGITYGDNEVKVLVDGVTGDVIHYSKVY